MLLISLILEWYCYKFLYLKIILVFVCNHQEECCLQSVSACIAWYLLCCVECHSSLFKDPSNFSENLLLTAEKMTLVFDENNERCADLFHESIQEVKNFWNHMLFIIENKIVYIIELGTINKHFPEIVVDVASTVFKGSVLKYYMLLMSADSWIFI